MRPALDVALAEPKRPNPELMPAILWQGGSRGQRFPGRWRGADDVERALRKRTRTIEFTIETERRMESRRAAAREFVGFCDGCAAEAVMVGAEEAARLAGVTTRTI